MCASHYKHCTGSTIVPCSKAWRWLMCMFAHFQYNNILYEWIITDIKCENHSWNDMATTDSSVFLLSEASNMGKLN